MQEDSSAPRCDLSVLIPAWNERGNLEVLLPALREVLGRLGTRTEVIVIDGGSRDGTPEAAVALGARLIVQTERGYGGALLAGFGAACSPYVLTMDADLSHPPVFIERMWAERAEADLIVASRYVPGGRAEMPRTRWLLSRILNVTFGVLLWLPVRDLSSGFRLYRRELIGRLRPLARDFDFLEEILVMAHRRGARIREVPFHYMPRGTGSSKARLIKFGWAFLKTLGRLMIARRQPA